MGCNGLLSALEDGWVDAAKYSPSPWQLGLF